MLTLSSTPNKTIWYINVKLIVLESGILLNITCFTCTSGKKELISFCILPLNSSVVVPETSSNNKFLKSAPKLGLNTLSPLLVNK
mgnify:CR=1 FL=1